VSASGQEKTEQPTGKRRLEGRKRGQIAKSRDLTSVGILLAGGITIYLSKNLIYSQFQRLIESLWSQESFIDPGYFYSGFATHLIFSVCYMIGPVVMALLITAVLLNVCQMKGFVISSEAMKISFSNMNPISGFRRMISLRSLTELIKSIAKITIVFWAIYSVLWPERASLLELAGAEISDIMQAIGMFGLKILIRVSGIMLFVGLLDFMYQKWQNTKDLKMTRHEVKEEAKQSEGNPQIKSRIRALQRSLFKQRMLSKVPKASVIITNPTHYAVAILYKSGMEAPIIIAKGMNFLAFKIMEIGRKHSVPIIQSPPLARALYKQVKVDETIPVTLYRGVAKILAYIYQQKQALRRNQNG